MRHTRVIWTVLFGLVLTAVVCQGQANVTLSPTSLTFGGQLPLLAQPPRHNRTHGTTHATNLLQMTAACNSKAAREKQ